ncbi:MAG: pyruvate formate lyase family protein [Candidatus Borkfalkiaceae bacterium]|nr:pyruvate formate lyase family protein [Clostridia bacterium]MDY6223130.1 pyruvate formate lyase family protein [Christensenellaceae bacterium]
MFACFYPYYKKDIDEGRIGKDEAFELICCLWLKLYRDYDVQQSCVGGTNPDGTSAVNELSYMMLDATERLDFIRCLSVRFSQATEKDFLKRALEVVGHVQKGIPFFFNDDVMIPALLSKGIAEEDAYNYTQLGCVETVIPGKSNPHAVTGETNFLKAMEYTLGNGRSLAYPEFSPGVCTGEIELFTTYQSFYDAVIKQADKILDVTCSQVKKYCDACIAPKAYKSLLTEGCLESGRDFNEKGAIYDYYQIMLGGIPNLADSLLVIKKFVYEEKKYTLREIKDILESNFADESVRMEFINKVSKFGNDIDEVDQIAVDLVNHACDELEKLEKKYGRSFHAQPFTFLWMIDHGKTSAASPDGRRKGEPIAYSVSPMQGRDFNGLTAVLNSIAKFPTKRTPGTTSAIVEVDPKLFTDRNIGALADILIASGKKGLSNVQFNTVDAETLIDAKRHPEKYNNLAVRVSGFSQKFNLLGADLQDHIIGRTKHTCL